MGWRGTLGLALALLAGSLYLYRELAAEHAPISWESVIEGPQTPPAEQITHLLSFDPATVTAIELRRDGQLWRTERHGDTWSGVGQAEVMNDFLTDLQGLAEIMPLDVPPDELADHGLAPPETVVELQRGTQAPVVLYVGRRNPPSTGVYAQLGPSGRVVLTGALALWELDKAIRGFSPTAAPAS